MEDLRLRTTYIVVRRVNDHYFHGLTCEDIVEVCSRSYSTPIIPVRIIQLVSQRSETSEFLVELSDREQVDLVQMKVSGMIHWRGRAVSCYAIEPSIDMLKVYGGQLVNPQVDLRKENKGQMEVNVNKVCGRIKTFSDRQLNHLSEVVDAELRKRMNQLTTKLTSLASKLKSHLYSLNRATEELVHEGSLQDSSSAVAEEEEEDSSSLASRFDRVDSTPIIGRVVDKPIHISSSGADSLQEIRYQLDSGNSLTAELLKSSWLHNGACLRCGTFEHLQSNCPN
jgi:hypothetical protein